MEALSLLVAYRHWASVLQHRRAYVTFRNDNMGALTVLASLKGTGHALGLIARELFLDIGRGEYLPRAISHLPGVANGTADALSRKFDPNKSG